MRSDEAIPGSWQIFASARRGSAERARSASTGGAGTVLQYAGDRAAHPRRSPTERLLSPEPGCVRLSQRGRLGRARYVPCAAAATNAGGGLSQRSSPRRCAPVGGAGRRPAELACQRTRGRPRRRLRDCRRRGVCRGRVPRAQAAAPRLRSGLPDDAGRRRRGQLRPPRSLGHRSRRRRRAAGAPWPRSGSSSAKDATPRRASRSWSRSRMLSFGWRTHEPRHVRRPPQSRGRRPGLAGRIARAPRRASGPRASCTAERLCSRRLSHARRPSHRPGSAVCWRSARSRCGVRQGHCPGRLALADELLSDHALPASEGASLAKLAEELRARAAQEHHHALLAELMEKWLRREPSGPDFDPDTLERVRIEAA
jgi:hypothetical protein